MARHRRALVLYKHSISPSPGPGDVILTEALPYRGAVSICRGANFKLKGLPMDELGVLPEALEAELTEKPKTSEGILIAPSRNCQPPGSRTHVGCNEEATRGAPKDHPPMDEAFKGQATVHRRDFRLPRSRCSRTRTHSFTVAAIRMRRSWGGYCLVRIVGPDRASLQKHRERRR
jgi:hypothetical protein